MNAHHRFEEIKHELIHSVCKAKHYADQVHAIDQWFNKYITYIGVQAKQSREELIHIKDKAHLEEAFKVHVYAAKRQVAESIIENGFVYETDSTEKSDSFAIKKVDYTCFVVMLI